MKTFEDVALKFISTRGMAPDTAPKRGVQCLVQYLEPCGEVYITEFAIAYFDNPNDYSAFGGGEGWCMWHNSRPIKVVAYAELPAPPITKIGGLKQQELLEKYGSFHPNLGCVGE